MSSPISGTERKRKTETGPDQSIGLAKKLKSASQSTSKPLAAGPSPSKLSDSTIDPNERDDKFAFEERYPHARRLRYETINEVASFCAGKPVDLGTILVNWPQQDQVARWRTELYAAAASGGKGKQGAAWIGEAAACGGQPSSSTGSFLSLRKTARTSHLGDASEPPTEQPRTGGTSASFESFAESQAVAAPSQRKPDLVIYEAPASGTEELEPGWKDIVALGEFTEDNTVALPTTDVVGRKPAQLATGLTVALRSQPTRARALGFLTCRKDKISDVYRLDLYALSRSHVAFCRVEDMFGTGLGTTIRILYWLHNTSLANLGFLPEFHREGKVEPTHFHPPTSTEVPRQLSPTKVFALPSSTKSTTVFEETPSSNSPDHAEILKLTWDKAEDAVWLDDEGRSVPREFIIMEYLYEHPEVDKQHMPKPVGGWVLGLREGGPIDGERVANVIAMVGKGAMVDEETFRGKEAQAYAFMGKVITANENLLSADIAHKDPSTGNFQCHVVGEAIEPFLIDYASSAYIGAEADKPAKLKGVERRINVFSGTARFMSAETFLGGQLPDYSWNAGQEWESIGFFLLYTLSCLCEAYRDAHDRNPPELPATPYDMPKVGAIAARAVASFHLWATGGGSQGIVQRICRLIEKIVHLPGLFPSETELLYWLRVLDVRQGEELCAQEKLPAGVRKPVPKEMDRRRSVVKGLEVGFKEWVDKRCRELPGHMKDLRKAFEEAEREAREELEEQQKAEAAAVA